MKRIKDMIEVVDGIKVTTCFFRAPKRVKECFKDSRKVSEKKLTSIFAPIK